MQGTHTLPIPPAILARASDAIARADRLRSFQGNGTQVSEDLIAASLEELNAEASRTLAISSRVADNGTVLIDGLDRHLAVRGFPGAKTAECIAGVLIGSGIASKASVADRRSHRYLRAIRLNTQWTWTIPTDERGVRPHEISFGNNTDPWTSLCPVCRSGRLEPVSGQQLYGISGKEYLECTNCGGKYVPVEGKFRLVAIARRQDPVWSNLLNRTFTAETWQEIARKGILPETGGRKTARPERPVTSSSGNTAQQIPVGIENRTLYFSPLPLVFSRGRQEDRFVARRDTLREILRLPAFYHLSNIVEERYRMYLDLPIGPVLFELRNRKDPLCNQFLNPFGDRNFCRFKVAESPAAASCGLYMIVIGNEVLAASGTILPFCELVDRMGNIEPHTCYLDGDPDRCRINALFCAERHHAWLYVHALDDKHEIGRIGSGLAARYSTPG